MLGNGKKISLWKHKRLGHQSFMLVFPELLNREGNKDARVMEVGEWNNNDWDLTMDFFSKL